MGWGMWFEKCDHWDCMSNKEVAQGKNFYQQKSTEIRWNESFSM